jgi:hypothetical protein
MLNIYQLRNACCRLVHSVGGNFDDKWRHHMHIVIFMKEHFCTKRGHKNKKAEMGRKCKT